MPSTAFLGSLPRYIPPAGGFPPLSSVVSALFGAEKRIDHLVQTLGNGMAGGLSGSGTEALAEVLSAFRAQRGVSRLYLGAYTCPDVVTAALRAGVEVRLLDIVPRTLEPVVPPSSEIPEGSAVLLSNLYGLRDQHRRWEELLRTRDLLLIDDRCQLPLPISEEPPRFPKSTAVVYSFSRGKGLSGVGGGFFVLPEGITGKGTKLSRSFSQSFVDAFKLALMRFFHHPRRYWVPASIPWLALGETRYHRECISANPSMVQALAAAVALELSPGEIEFRRACVQRWKRAIGTAPVIFPVDERGEIHPVLIRFPVLVPSAHRERLLSELKSSGLSSSYPAPLHVLCGGDVALHSSVDGAIGVSQSILTLPLHRGLEDSDIERIGKRIAELLQ